MLDFIKGSDKLIIVLHEIYGVNIHIQQVCEKYFAEDFDVLCPDMLHREEPFSYESEKEAYNNFTDNIGFERAAEEIGHLILKVRDKYSAIYLVGFSAGATVAWLCSGSNTGLAGVICYYGSRIRNYTVITPEMPVFLIFAEEEKSFNVSELVKLLGIKKNVEVCVLDGKHGFSDPHSMNYKEQAASKAEKLVLDFLLSSY